MLQAWKAVGIWTYGLHHRFADRHGGIGAARSEIIKRQADRSTCWILHPHAAAGSEDHRSVDQGVFPCTPTSTSTIVCVVTGHGQMSQAEWEGAYRRLQDLLNARALETILRRARASGATSIADADM